MVPKYKHGSVERNQLKRRLREIVRRRVLHALEGLAPADVVIRTLPAAYVAPFEALERQVMQSCERAARRAATAPPSPPPSSSSHPDGSSAAGGVPPEVPHG